MNGRCDRAPRAIKKALVLGCLVIGWGAFADGAAGQQAPVAPTRQIVNDGFYENFGVNWGFNRRGRRGGWFANSGGPAVPPFGGFDPTAQATLGFGGNGFSLNFFGGAGSSRGIVSETPFITIPNGGYGVLNHSSLRPFVTGVVPVVGGRPMTVLDERLQRLREEPPAPRESADGMATSQLVDSPQRVPPASVPPARSSAETAEASVAEIQRQHVAEDAERAQEVAKLIERGKTAEAGGKTTVARIYYEQAARRARGELRQRLQARIAALQSSTDGR